MSWLRVGYIQFGGVLVALLGFAITRLFVAEAFQTETTLSFVFSGLVPLVIGLGITVYGVALAVGAFSDTYVNTVTKWVVTGTGAMVIVLGVTLVDEIVLTGTLHASSGSRILVATVVLSGAVAGALVGHRSAEIARHRQMNDRKSNRALLVTRLLKHDVINNATIIGGYADVLSTETDSTAVTAIQESVDQIEETVREIGTIADETEDAVLEAVDVATALENEIERIEGNRDVDIQLTSRSDDTDAVAGPGLQLVFRELLGNALVHGGESPVAVLVDVDGPELCASIRNDGPELPDEQRALLEEGQFPEYDDPTAGFGLQFVRLIVQQYNGQVTVSNGERTTITVRLPRTHVASGVTTAVGVTFPNLYRAGAIGILAGVAMGVVYSIATGMFPVIGALYQVESAVVGWVTHLFHSIVFALAFAAGITRLSKNQHTIRRWQSTVLGAGWGILLWFVAAGFVMPLWLRLVGIHAAVPTLTAIGLVGHVVWGIVLGFSYPPFPRSNKRSR